MIRKTPTAQGGNPGGYIMKRTIPVALILVLALSTMVAPEAGAGWLDKLKNKDKENKAAPRYDLFPSMTYHKGVLSQGAGHSWQLDGVNILVRSDCAITSELTAEAVLGEGQEALVMGTRLGDTIVAYRVRLVKPDYMNDGSVKSSQVTPSEVDPTVGVGTGPE